MPMHCCNRPDGQGTGKVAVLNWLTGNKYATFRSPARSPFGPPIPDPAMLQKILNFPSLPLLLGGAAFALAMSSCSSPRPPDELARAVAIGERPVAMAGSSPFFDGTLKAEVTISRGIGRGTDALKHGGDRAKILSLEGMDKEEAAAYIITKNDIGSPLPPVTMRLKLSNLQRATVSVEIRDFNSDLGNFAVVPGILTVEPGQSSEPDPMISQLGVTSDEIPVKVTLRMGAVTESKTILVKALPQAGH
jgi:hypothetical protein